MTRTDEAADRLIVAINVLAPVGREGIGEAWPEVRYDIEQAMLELREALTPHGDPIFVQIAAGRRPYQMLVLAVEYWISRGCMTGSPSWCAVTACGNVCSQAVLESVRRAS